MSEYAYFYNSENGDRVYDADSFSNWLKKFFTTGVFEGDCQVTALGSMVVNLAPGYANIMGKVKELENQTFTLEPADGSYPRIDTIVIERNDTDRDITAKVVTGQLSGNDPVPTPRVWENGVYQLIVAEVYVAAGATEVTQADITDKRSDPDVCGIVAGTVTEMDFSQFTAQFESYFEQFKASNLEEFSEWFEMIKGQLSEDAAGHLQNEIDVLDGRISANTLAIGAINSNLSGFKFYPTGTDIVGLIADDSAYMDENGNYIVWGTATANQLVADNPNTYKSVPSEEDTRGMAGADSAVPFKGKDFNINDDWEVFENFVGKAQSKTYNLESGITYIFFCSMVYDYSISCFSVKDNVITYYIQSTSGQAVPNITCVNNVLTLSGFNDGYDRFIGAFKITNKGVKLEVSPQTPSNTVNLRKGCIMHLIPDKTYLVFETGNYATTAYMFWVKNNIITYIKQGIENIPITCVDNVLTIGNGTTDYGQNRVIIFH